MSATKDVEISVEISKDQMAAVMRVPSDYQGDILTVDLCIAQFKANGVALDPHALSQIEKFVAAYRDTPDQAAPIILAGRSPIKGLSGRLDLAPECRRPDPEILPADGQVKSEGDDVPAQSAVDHYARSPYIHVISGQVIGQIIAPTEGEYGVEITGNPVASVAGKPFNLKPHDSILVDSKGAVFAQCSGTLEHAGTTVRVNSVLVVDGQVDFETANIDFEGDVEIAKGVCDNFKVTALRNAVINGVVEAADLSTGGDLNLTTGMFGKDKGTLKVGRECRAKFIQQVRGEVGGDLCVDKEIVNSDLAVRGGIFSPHASLIGGDCHAMGAVQFKVIGSDTGVRTVLHLGSFPECTRVMEKTVDELDRLQASVEAFQKKLDMINGNSRSLVADTKEELTELMFEQMSAQEEYDSLKEMAERLSQGYNAKRCIELHVAHTIYPGSVVVLGHSAAKFVEPVRGPISIQADRSGELCYRQGGAASQPIRGIAKLIYWD